MNLDIACPAYAAYSESRVKKVGACITVENTWAVEKDGLSVGSN
jgi:hypothetical protein